MFDYLLNEAQKKLRDETREFVKSIPRKMILDMDADIIQFPKEFLQEAGKRNLMGCRYPKKWGGQGNGLGFHLHGHGRGGNTGLYFCLHLWGGGRTCLRRHYSPRQ